MDMKLDTVVVSLNTVLGHYARGFQPKQGSLLKWDAYTDTGQGKVVFQLFVDKNKSASVKRLSDNWDAQVSEYTKDEINVVLERAAHEVGITNPARVAAAVNSAIDGIAAALSEEMPRD